MSQRKITTGQQSTATFVLCSIDATSIKDDNTQWVHLIPADADNKIIGEDGRGWLYDDAALLTSAANATQKLPIDYHHASLDAADTGAKAPAAGWIDPTTIESKDNGLWGMVEWTANAADDIRNGAFRYTSPVFRVSNGRAVALKGSALTHYPNLHDLTPVANMQQKENDEMDELLERLRHMLNLPTLATPEEVKSELDKGFAKLKKMGGDTAANAERLVDVIAGIDAAIKTNAANSTAANSTADMTTFVPRVEFDRIASDLRTLTMATEETRVETAVNAALGSGVLAPASLAWAKDYCRKDGAGFAQFVANSAKVVPMGEESARQTAGSAALNDEELAVCSQLGVSKEDFLKMKEEEVH